MMKRLISLYTFLLIALVCRAEYVQIDCIQYNMNAETQQAGVIRFSNGDSDIVIPEKVTHNGEEYPVTSIGNYAFSFCSNLTKFYCYAKEVPFTNSERTFDEYPITSATLYVPASAIEAYKATAPWSGFGTIVALTDEEITQAIDSAKAPSIRIEAHDGNIVAQGAKAGTLVSIYTTDGTKVASAVAGTASTLTLPTAIPAGEMVIIKYDSKSVKVMMK